MNLVKWSVPIVVAAFFLLRGVVLAESQEENCVDYDFNSPSAMSIRLEFAQAVDLGKPLPNHLQTEVEKLAEGCDWHLAYHLGNIFYHGQSVGKDIGMAYKWYAKAAAHGHIEAFYMMGLIYQEDEVMRDSKKSIEIFQVLAENGHAKAQHNLGSAYFGGDGVPVDIEKAKYYYNKAADAGVVAARRGLGLIAFGEENFSTAAEHFAVAAKKKDPVACTTWG